MEMIKAILKVILAILIIISILGFICSYEIMHTILNKNYIIKKMEQTNYYDNLYSNIRNKLEGYIGPSGLDEKILNHIITRENVKRDVHLFIESIYENKEFKIEIENIEEQLENNIQEYLKEENLEITDEENIKEFKQEIIKEYEKGISYNFYTKNIQNLPINKINKMVKTAETLCITTIIVVTICYLLLDLKKVIKNISEIMTFFLVCGIITNVVIIFIKTNLIIDNVIILNGAVSILIREIVKNILSNLRCIGIILIIISLILIILCNISKDNRSRKWKN